MWRVGNFSVTNDSYVIIFFIRYADFMSFDRYFEKKQREVKVASSLEALIVRRKRISIGNNVGLPYKSEQGRLVTHRYTVYQEEKSKMNKK